MQVTLTTELTLDSDLHSAALLTACHAVRVIRVITSYIILMFCTLMLNDQDKTASAKEM